jgi:hypothetical protein
MAFTPVAFSVTSSGLTTATTAYSNGDTLGTIFTVSGAAASSGGFGHLRNIRINDYADIVASVTLFIYRSSPTLAADNAAWAVSDADNDNLVGQLFVTLADNGANRQGFVIPHMMYDCAATSLFIGIRADSISASFFGAATDIRLRGYLDTVT